MNSIYFVAQFITFFRKTENQKSRTAWVQWREIVQEILLEAHSYGLMDEVRETASKIMLEDIKIDRVTAYQMAFDEWVK